MFSGSDKLAGHKVNYREVGLKRLEKKNVHLNF